MDKFSLDLNETDQQKIKRIINLIPAKGIDVIERTRLNKTIRKELEGASNEVVCCLVVLKEHQLSLVELRRRFKEKRFNNLRELFWILELIYDRHNTGRNELYEKVRKEIERITPMTDSIEIVEIVRCHLNYGGFVNRMKSLEMMILCSPNREEITKEIKDIEGSSRMVEWLKNPPSQKANGSSPWNYAV